MKVSDHHGSFFALSARGDFGGESRGSTPKSVYLMLARPFGSRKFGSSSHSLQPSRSVVLVFLVVFCTTLWPRLLLRFLFPPPSLPMRRNLNPPLSTSHTSIQLTVGLQIDDHNQASSSEFLSLQTKRDSASSIRS